MGVLPIRPVAESLTRQPVSVVNTHYHFDHIGGNWEFSETLSTSRRAADRAGGAARAARRLPGLRRPPARRGGEAYRRLDWEYSGCSTPESDPAPVARGIGSRRLDDPGPSRAPGRCVDGDRVDLGGRELTVIFAPGHSPDGICLPGRARGLPVRRRHLQRRADLRAFPRLRYRQAGAVGRAAGRDGGCGRRGRLSPLSAPGGRAGAAAGVRPGIGAVAAGEAPLVKGRDVLDGRLLEARFDHFTASIADPEA